MKVTVKLIGPLIYESGFSEKEFEFPGPLTAGELSAYMKLEGKRPTIVTRNGVSAAPADPLQDGDRVVISPLYSGG